MKSPAFRRYELSRKAHNTSKTDRHARAHTSLLNQLSIQKKGCLLNQLSIQKKVCLSACTCFLVCAYSYASPRRAVSACLHGHTCIFIRRTSFVNSPFPADKICPPRHLNSSRRPVPGAPKLLYHKTCGLTPVDRVNQASTTPVYHDTKWADQLDSQQRQPTHGVLSLDNLPVG